MDWNKLRQQWQQHDAPSVPAVSIDKLQLLDQTLQKQVRRRDRIETVAAWVIAVFFTLMAAILAAGAKWAACGFCLLLVAWAIALPLKLRHARRQLPENQLPLPLIENLVQQRNAALAQAQMLEQVWLWYLTPPAIGIFGLTLTLQGATGFALIYLSAVTILYLAIAWVNRQTAKTVFRAHAAELKKQIDAFNSTDEA